MTRHQPRTPICHLVYLLGADSADQNDGEKYTNAAILQAGKFLDTLVTIGPNDFQVYEWLSVSDTVDAVYRSAS